MHSISEKLDTGSASGRLFYNILSAMSQWEREVISERTKAALSVKRENGQRVSGKAPYGFAFDDNGNCVMVDNEQAVISRARELKTEGRTVRGIVGYLEEQGHRNRAGKAFGISEVWKMLKA